MHDLFRDWLIVGIDAGIITVGRAAEIAGESLEDWRTNTRHADGKESLERIAAEWKRWDEYDPDE